MTLEIDPRLTLALGAALGMVLMISGIARRLHRQHMRTRVRALAQQWSEEVTVQQPAERSALSMQLLAGRLGARLAERMPAQVGVLAARMDRAGLAGGMATIELLGWKVIGLTLGGVIGLASVVRYGAPGLVGLGLAVLIGWFGIDLMLARYHARRRRSILRELPTVMDLLVLSLEAGMGLDRALRTVVHEYNSAFSDEIRRVLNDVDLGLSRGQAFERLAQRVGLEDLRALSRAMVQSEELGVSLVGVMRVQSHDVRLSRRRAAEAEALRAPIKMLVPLAIFILPTLFLLLLGPVGLRASASFSGVPPP